jgi:hypothetical protein
VKERKVFSESVKNILIILLLFSAVFLGWQSRLFGNSSVKLDLLANFVDDQAADVSGGGIVSGATNGAGEARPIGIAVTDASGDRYGVRYDLEKVEEVYKNAVIIFREALGSAQEPEKVGEKEWRAALSAPGVYFEYMSPVSLSVLDGWYGGEMAGDWGGVCVRRLFAAAVGGETRLCFEEAETGLFYAAGTKAAPERITRLNELYQPNRTVFAFEALGAQPLKVPYALIMPEMTAYAKLEASNPLAGETLAEVLRKLGVSAHKKPIINESGNQVYPEDEFRIELSPDGTLSYRWTGSRDGAAELDQSAAIETARRVVADTIGKHCGDAARVYFDAVSSSGSSYRVTFTYVAEGGLVYLGRDGYAAAVTVTDGYISAMELRFRNYKVSDVNLSLLPEIQAAAAADGAFMLCYTDGGADILEPAWIAVSPNS